MGASEDTRKVLQDFLAPELRAISVRLDALEKRFEERSAQTDKRSDERFVEVDKRFQGVDKRFDRLEQRLDDLERTADKRHDEVMAAIRQVIDFNSIQQRLARRESKESAHQ